MLHRIRRYLFIGGAVAFYDKMPGFDACICIKTVPDPEHRMPGADRGHILSGGITGSVGEFQVHAFADDNGLDALKFGVIGVLLGDASDARKTRFHPFFKQFAFRYALKNEHRAAQHLLVQHPRPKTSAQADGFGAAVHAGQQRAFQGACGSEYRFFQPIAPPKQGPGKAQGNFDRADTGFDVTHDLLRPEAGLSDRGQFVAKGFEIGKAQFRRVFCNQTPAGDYRILFQFVYFV